MNADTPRFAVYVRTPDREVAFERPFEGEAILRSKEQAEAIAAQAREQAARSGWRLSYAVRELRPMGERRPDGACSQCGASGFTYSHEDGGYPCMTCGTVKPERKEAP